MSRKPESITLRFRPDLSPADLDELVKNFNETRRELKPFIRAKRPELFGQNSGLPALGWLTALRRSGDSLEGDFENVPPTVAGIIRQGDYILGLDVANDTEINGKRYRRVIRSVSFDSAALPTISGINDVLTKCYSEKGELMTDDFLENNFDEIQREARSSGTNFKTALSAVYSRSQGKQDRNDYARGECFEDCFDKIATAHPELSVRGQYLAATELNRHQARTGRSADTTMRQLRYENESQFLMDLKKITGKK